jgi:5-methylcytosine-specific restriction endonuclease McrA
MGFYQSAQWSRARRQALHDAGHRCTRCGCSLLNKGRAAHVHHRKELKRAPALRIEPLNLAPLCERCHTTVHELEKKPQMTNIDGSPSDPRHPWYVATTEHE